VAGSLHATGSPKRGSRWPLALLLAAATIPLLLFAGLSALEYVTLWRQTERELARSADATAEYSLRVLETHRLAADRINDLLSGLSDADIRDRELELHHRLRAIIPSLPLVQTVAVLARDGYPLLTGNVYPVPRDRDFKDREWVRDLSRPEAPRTHISKVNIGRLDDFLFFGVSRRRTGAGNGVPEDEFDGVINISVQPNHMSSGFADLTTEPGDVVLLFREDGEILARRPSFTSPPPPAAEFARVASAGPDRGSFRLSSPIDGVDRLNAYRQIEGYPLYALVARDTSTIMARWRDRLFGELVFGVPAIVLLWTLVALAFRDSRLVRQAQLELAHEQAQRAAEANFRAVFESGVVGMAILSIADGRVTAVNDRLLAMTGHSRADVASGKWSWSAVTPPEFADEDERAMTNVSEGRGPERYEKDLARADASRLPVRASLSLLPGSPGQAVVLVEDISRHREAELRRQLMVHEVEHRARNMLAVVQSSVRMSARTALDGRTLAAAIEGRIAALGRVQSLLTASGWLDADLATMIRAELAVYQDEDPAAARYVLDGPPLRLPANVAQSLSMVVHELATNAAKYGALSSSQGRVTVRWSIAAGQSALCLSWIEEGGPKPGRDQVRAGFGTMLIDTMVQQQLGGTIERRWESGGLVCEIRTEIQLPATAAPARSEHARVLRTAE
jgi:PAS domain S-box-containing protein